ncbi:unnamed protein product, partial [Heterosigma akashiwo]
SGCCRAEPDLRTAAASWRDAVPPAARGPGHAHAAGRAAPPWGKRNAATRIWNAATKRLSLLPSNSSIRNSRTESQPDNNTLVLTLMLLLLLYFLITSDGRINLNAPIIMVKSLITS